MYWAIRHVVSITAAATGKPATPFFLIYAVAFTMLVWQMTLALIEPVYQATPRQMRQINRQRVAVLVPVYNEDPAALRACITSLLYQTRQPDVVVVVDDGSTKADYSHLIPWFVEAGRSTGIETRWVVQANAGKRHAQGTGVRETPNVDYYLTVDSDSVLAENALAEALKPFLDPRVHSVAGVIVALNSRKNLLTRLTDLWFVTGQLVDRSALSTMGAVLVNSGPLAVYRAWVLRDNLDGYLNETFLGRRVDLSDDSMLTIYALTRGRAVQQPTAVAFSLMPEQVGTHLRQYLRWMRGAFIRSWWRLKYLPLGSYAFWAHLIGWVQMAVSTAVFGYLFIIAPTVDPQLIPAIPWLLLIPVLVGYGQSLRYLTLSRSDQTLRSQLLAVVLSPVATVWAFTVLRAVRWYGMFTCRKTGWGTRAKIEVRLDTPTTA